MKSKKLLRFIIMDALELVLSENGITTPSKKIRKTIIKASERISNTIQKDRRGQNREIKVQNVAMKGLFGQLQRIEEGVNA